MDMWILYVDGVMGILLLFMDYVVYVVKHVCRLSCFIIGLPRRFVGLRLKNRSIL